MPDDFDKPLTGTLPAVVQLTPASSPIAIDKITEAVLAELTPGELASLVRRMFELANFSESEPSRVAAGKFLLDRFAPKEDLEQKRRETEERHDAIAEAKGLMAEFALAKSAGLYEPPELDQSRAAQSTDADGA